MEAPSNQNQIQGVDLTKIAAEFGTPVYVYDAEKITGQIRRLRNAFSQTNVRIKYAAKALTNISILKVIRSAGAEVEVVSLEEGAMALRAGFNPGEITFTPSGVDFAEIEKAVSSGFLINLDNLSSLRKFGAKYGNKYACGIRLNPGIMAGGNLKISTGHASSKFGISIHQLQEILSAVKEFDINVSGLHIHTGSDILDPNVFLQMAEILFDAAQHFKSIRFIDFGSGFKVAYKEGDKVTDIEDLGLKLSRVFNDFCAKSARQLELWIEPGKFVVSEAGVFLVQVNVVKQTPTITFAGVNSGLNHLIRPMMYDAYHHIDNISNPSGPTKTYNIVGYICETDTFAADRAIQEIRERDILAFRNAGAYGFSMSSNYNSRLRPAEVLIINGESRLIREREQIEDLLKHQIVIDL
jgi:diaminopimelate decarboxylase